MPPFPDVRIKPGVNVCLQLHEGFAWYQQDENQVTDSISILPLIIRKTREKMKKVKKVSLQAVCQQECYGSPCKDIILKMM